MYSELVDSMKGYPVALLILAALLASTAGFQAILGYTKPNIGYHSRSHRGFDRTFFIRNLDSVHYRQPLYVVVSAVGLRYVSVHAGPWCTRKPRELDSVQGKTRVRIVFDEIPEDASFALRAVSDHGELSIEIDPASPLQSRSFGGELPSFSTLRRLRYYAFRFLLGYAGLVAVFLLSLRWNGYTVYAGDWVLIAMGLLVAVISFGLVVPYRGKSTIVGYLGPIDTLHFWSDRSVLFATASGSMPSIHEPVP